MDSRLSSLILTVYLFLVMAQLNAQAIEMCPEVPNGPFEPDQSIFVTLPVNGFENIIGFQFSLQYDVAAFQYIGATSDVAPNINVTNPTGGELRIQWSQLAGIPASLADGTILMTFEFQVTASADELLIPLTPVIDPIFIDSGGTIPLNYCNSFPAGPIDFCPITPSGPFTAGQIAEVFIPVANFTDLISAWMSFDFDDQLFEFQQLSGEALPFTSAFVGPNGDLRVVWSNVDGTTSTIPDGDHFAAIQFLVLEDTEIFEIEFGNSDNTEFRVPFGFEVPYNYCGNIQSSVFTDLCLQVPLGPVEIGEQITIPVEVSNFGSVTAAYVPIGFDTSVWEFQGAFVDLPGEPLTASWDLTAQGARIFILDDDASGVFLEDGEIFTQLSFLAKQNADSVAISIDPSVGTFAVSYDPFYSRLSRTTTCGKYFVGTLAANVRANIQIDSSGSCSGDNIGERLRSWLVTFTLSTTGVSYTARADQFGHAFLALPAGVYSYEWTPPSNPDLWETCQTTNLLISPTTTIDDPIESLVTVLEECSALSVQVSSTNLRPCFDNNRFFVSYANEGTATAEAAYIDLLIDEAFTPIGNNPVYQDLGDGLYRFLLGDLAPNQFGNFTFQGTIDCDFTIGAAICAEATIYPYRTDCFFNNSPAFQGGQLSVSSQCEGDSIRFTVENIGTGPTGSVSLVIVEDVVIYMNSDLDLGPDQTIDFMVPAGGTTFRLETGLPDNAPYKSQGLSIKEGCGTLPGGGISTGFVTAFSLLDEDPWIDRYCLETSAAYDPNDKLAIPNGVGANNAIMADQRMDYNIRFQNTGTDTAFTVIIRDTIDTNTLDISSIRPGISSHDYRLNVEDNVMIFTFENIQLVDSFTNEPLSNGFVHFTIAQQPGLAPGTIIENVAAIYFDFNAPIFTPPSRQTIRSEVLVSKVANFTNQANIPVFPSPTHSQITIDLSNQPQLTHCVIYDAFGREVLHQMLPGNQQHLLDLQLLPAGRYVYRLHTGDAILQTGVIVKSK